ncbi:lipase 3-like [Ctenocephalides felis]|uniref:lipase 3-like n=1 Tax=Ctenocephalides felis TaxID=7515 RepID=UPI000E6E3AAA|nr:lipase 3-like [Ctenocephalides felis]
MFLLFLEKVTDFISQFGYPHETHHVVTEDGYILEMHHIPSTRSLKNRPKGSVFLMHGLMSSSADWVVTGPEKGLAYILADAGYDVWLGNARGNKYSRHHVSLDPDAEDDHDFWKFSWHEIGTQDLPAMIDYVLETTNQRSLSYVGHSQGTTSFFVMTSERPEYNQKIKSMHALAPVAYIGHCWNPYALAGMPLIIPIENLDKKYGPREMFPANDDLTKISNFLCSDENAIRGVCVKLYLAAFGFDPWNTLIPDIMNNIPAGASSRQFIHYAQLIRNKRFAKYDHGVLDNKDLYNSLVPPNYDLAQISCPVALYYGDMDNLATPQDVKHLSKELPNVLEVYRVPHDRWNHMDFLWAVNVKKLLYDRVVENIEKYN